MFISIIFVIRAAGDLLSVCIGKEKVILNQLFIFLYR